MRKSKILMTALALASVLVLTVGTAMAYFTDHTSASGSTPITLGSKTTIVEPTVEVNETEAEKTIVVSNEGPESCYVRVKAFWGSELDVVMVKDAYWTEAPAGTYTYSEILAAGEDTSAHPLKLTISGLPETANEGDTLNVVVVYESTKVTYDENGDPEAPNWEMATVVVEKPEGGEQ